MHRTQRFLFFILTLSAWPSLTAAEADDPANELATFEVADGFEVNLFASEADGVVNPIQIRFDPAGRLWVIQSTVYPMPRPGESPDDKILILEDTDGDGRSDKTTVFADGLTIPTGLEIGAGGAYVGHGTELLHLKDTDGDLVADEREVLLRGFGTGDNHQNINSFAWGPGGALWMSQGLHNFSNVETPWGIVRLHRAGIWRFFPKRMKLQGFYGSHHEPQNPWGFVFTQWGEPIEIAGNYSSIMYPVPGLVPRRLDERPVLIWENGNGRKNSGGAIVGTEHFPPDWQGALILGGYINNALWTVDVHENGAGFRLTDREPLIRSSSRNFRPVDVKFGPRGDLYVCDWFNPIIGHYQASFRHPDRDKSHGRIWRITAKDRPLTEPPKLTATEIPQLLDHLESSDRWTRHFAKRELMERNRDAVIPALNNWIDDSQRTELGLKEALGVYQGFEHVKESLLKRLLSSPEFGARAYAAGVAGIWADRLDDPLNLLLPAAEDEHPRVRLHAVMSSSWLERPGAIRVAALAANHPVDPFLTYGLRQTVFALKPHWLPALQTGSLDLAGDPRLLGNLVRLDGTPDTVSVVRSLAFDESTGEDNQTYRKILAEHGASEDLDRLLNSLDTDALSDLLPDITANIRLNQVEPGHSSIDLLRHWLESEESGERVQALKLAGAWQLDAFSGPAVMLATDADQPEDVRVAAIQTLGQMPAAIVSQALEQIASKAGSLFRSHALATLAGHDTEQAAALAAGFFADNPDDRADIQRVVETFLKLADGPGALASAFTQTPPPSSIASLILETMNASGRTHPELLNAVNASIGATNRQRSLDQVAHLVSKVRGQGDANRGKQVYERPSLGCVACHAIDGTGGTIGPNLSSLGTAQPVDFIIGALLEPQKEIKEGYIAASITTKSGEEYQGYLQRESATEVVIREVLGNEEIRLRPDAIASRQIQGSVMPPGLTDSLTDQEFADLVKYLSELGTR